MSENIIVDKIEKTKIENNDQQINLSTPDASELEDGNFTEVLNDVRKVDSVDLSTQDATKINNIDSVYSIDKIDSDRYIQNIENAKKSIFSGLEQSSSSANNLLHILSNNEELLNSKIVDNVNNRSELENIQGDLGKSFNLVENYLNDIYESSEVKPSVDFVHSSKEISVENGNNPLKGFMNYLVGSERNLTSISEYVSNISTTNLTPAELLHVQNNIFGVQQNLEFFSNTLNKGLEFIKNIMQTQI